MACHAVLEDVPRQVKALGQETAFFSTNCGMQEPLIKGVIDLAVDAVDEELGGRADRRETIRGSGANDPPS